MYNFFFGLYTILWYRLFCLVTSPLYLTLFFFILRVFFFNTVDCHWYDSTIVVIDRINNVNQTYFDSWLVHRDVISPHLGLDMTVINDAFWSDYPEYTTDWGYVYISPCVIDYDTWLILIDNHPEMVYDGVSCTIDYFVNPLDGPCSALDTLDFFLNTYCV